MNLNKAVKIQISAAIIMALLGGSLCKFSQSYISNYDKPITGTKVFKASVLPMGNTKAWNTAEKEEDNQLETPTSFEVGDSNFFCSIPYYI